MNTELRRLVLLLAVLVIPSGGHELRTSVSTSLEDTNAYVCPPAASGGVGRDVRGPSYSQHSGAISYGVVDPRYYSGHGYASFNLSQVPDSCAVASVRLHYYQYEHSSYGGGLPSTDIVLISGLGGGAQALFDRVGSGVQVSGTMSTPDGWVTRNFNQTGIDAVDSCRKRNQTVYFGLRGGSYPYGAAYGAGPCNPWRAYLAITYVTSAGYIDVVALEGALESYPLAVGDSAVFCSRYVNTGNRTAYDFP